MPDSSPSPTDPNSTHSKTARLACWLTGGGTRRSPTTAVSFLQMARERNAVKKAETEWNKRKKAALDAHVEQWGNTGWMGMVEEVAAIGPRPRGTALLSWWGENGGGREGGRGRRTEDETMNAVPAGAQVARGQNTDDTALAVDGGEGDVGPGEGGGERNSGMAGGENSN